MIGVLFPTLAAEIRDHVAALVFTLPGRLGNRAREQWLRSRGATLEGRAFIARRCSVMGPENIRLGNNFRCGLGCFLTAEWGQLSIGTDVSLNQGVSLNASVAGEIVVGDRVLMGLGGNPRSASELDFSGYPGPSDLFSGRAIVPGRVTA